MDSLPFQLTYRRREVAPVEQNLLMDSARRVYSLVNDLGRNYLVFRDMVDTSDAKPKEERFE